MNSEPYTLGFCVVGNSFEERRLIDHAAAFNPHAECNPKAEVDKESYLSAFQFGADFKVYLQRQRTPKGFAGSCWSPWLWLDIDRKDDLDAALNDNRRLASFILYRYFEFADEDLLLFFSASKGFHVSLPLVHRPPSSPLLHLTCRKLAERVAEEVGAVKIDTTIYDRVRCFRAPNSRHPKTSLHKRQLSYQELMRLDVAAIRRGPQRLTGLRRATRRERRG